MPKIEEYAEVRVNGEAFRDWTGVHVTWAIGTPPVGIALTLAEPTASAKSYDAMRLKPGDRCDVLLAGQFITENGLIETRQAAYDAQRHQVQVTAVSNAIKMVDSAVDVQGGQYKNSSFSAIAASVLKEHGLTFRMVNAPAGADRPFPSAMIQHGETGHEFLERLARQRGIWLSGDTKGNIIGGVPDGGGSIRVQEGVDILAARCAISDKDIREKIWVRGQMQGSDQSSGKAVSQVSVVVTNPAGAPAGKKSIVIAEEPVDQKGAQDRAEQEMRKQIGTSVECSVTVRGWLRSDGKLWQPGDKVNVYSPMLFPTEGGDMDLQALEVVFGQDESGTTTTLNLVLEGMFANKTAGGNQASRDFFTQKPGTATPESST